MGVRVSAFICWATLKGKMRPRTALGVYTSSGPQPHQRHLLGPCGGKGFSVETVMANITLLAGKTTSSKNDQINP